MKETKSFDEKDKAKSKARLFAIEKMDNGYEVACYHYDNKSMVIVTNREKDTYISYDFIYLQHVDAGQWCMCWNEDHEHTRFICKVIEWVNKTGQPIFETHYESQACFDYYYPLKIDNDTISKDERS